MVSRLIVAAFCLALPSCQQPGGRVPAVQSPGVPSPVSAASPERPWKAHLQWGITNVNWAGEPGAAKSRFDGRCSVDSDYVVTAKFDGEATHTGRFTGSGSHCTQITWTPSGPGAVAYSDGRGEIVAADGSTIVLRWGEGQTGFDAATGETWFKDQFSFQGGTGRFDGATGGGEEGGRFTDFMALLAGKPVAMTMEGTIGYGEKK